ncbi:MAG: sugar phosphate isomerase/epimerase [Bacteroidota bacterium]
MLNRREFIRNSLVASLALPGLSLDLSPPAGPQIGIILNTVQQEMEADWKATASRLADLGYTFLEGKVHRGGNRAYRKYVKNLGLHIMGSGIRLDDRPQKMAQQLRQAEKRGQEFVCCYWPWRSSAKDLSREECLATAERLNRFGRLIKQAGFQLTWHNHDKEFVTIEGQTALDWLMEQTDPAYVNLQLDTYWAVKGGGNPLDILARYPGRVPLTHLKDMAAGPDQAMCCVGDGLLDWQALWSAQQQAGVRYASLELDRAEDGLGCAQSAMQSLISAQGKD